MRRGPFAKGSIPQPPRGWRAEPPGPRRVKAGVGHRRMLLPLAMLILAVATGAGQAQRVLQGGVAQSGAAGDSFATGRPAHDDRRTEITPKTSAPEGYRCLPPDPAWTLVAERGDGFCEWLAPPSGGASGRPPPARRAAATRTGGDRAPPSPAVAAIDRFPRPADGPATLRRLRGTAVDIYRDARPFPSPPELQAMYGALRDPSLGLLVQCAANYTSAIDNIRRYAGRYFQHDLALGDACSRRLGVPPDPVIAPPAPRPAPATDRLPARPGDPHTICTGVDLASLVFGRYGTGRPISIAKVAGRRTYVVLLAGTEFDLHQKNNAITDGFEAGDIGSEYDSAVLHALSFAVPPGSELIFVGHSLGGMVAQNLTRRFARSGFFGGRLKVTHIISFGSPKTGADVPGVAYRRFVIPFDPVPKLTAPANQSAAGLTYVDGGAFQLHVPLVGEHLLYPKSASLKLFDAYGRLAGHDCLTLDPDPLSFPAR